MANFVSQYTGSQIEEAIGNAIGITNGVMGSPFAMTYTADWVSPTVYPGVELYSIDTTNVTFTDYSAPGDGITYLLSLFTSGDRLISLSLPGANASVTNVYMFPTQTGIYESTKQIVTINSTRIAVQYKLRSIGGTAFISRTLEFCPQFWKGTQTEYDALASHSNDVIYIITGA